MPAFVAAGSQTPFLGTSSQCWRPAGGESRLRLGVSGRKSGGVSVIERTPARACARSRRCLHRGRRLPPGIGGVLPPSRLARQECEGSAFSRAQLPFRGAPGAGPSRAAELTGSVCPTGRAALAKNSALPSGPCARREPGPRLWEFEPRKCKEPRELRAPRPRAWPRCHPPRPRPRARRCPHRCRRGWKAREPRSGPGRPGWEPTARPPARSPGPRCPCWGLPPARSARTRLAAEVRPAARGRTPRSSQALAGASFCVPTRGRRRGTSGWSHRAGGAEPGAVCKLTFSLKKSPSRCRVPEAVASLTSVFLSGKWDNKIVKL